MRYQTPLIVALAVACCGLAVGGGCRAGGYPQQGRSRPASAVQVTSMPTAASRWATSRCCSSSRARASAAALQAGQEEHPPDPGDHATVDGQYAPRLALGRLLQHLRARRRACQHRKGAGAPADGLTSRSCIAPTSPSSVLERRPPGGVRSKLCAGDAAGDQLYRRSGLAPAPARAAAASAEESIASTSEMGRPDRFDSRRRRILGVVVFRGGQGLPISRDGALEQVEHFEPIKPL